MRYLTKLFKRDIKTGIITIFHMLMMTRNINMLSKDMKHIKDSN